MSEEDQQKRLNYYVMDRGSIISGCLENHIETFTESESDSLDSLATKEKRLWNPRPSNLSTVYDLEPRASTSVVAVPVDVFGSRLETVDPIDQDNQDNQDDSEIRKNHIPVRGRTGQKRSRASAQIECDHASKTLRVRIDDSENPEFWAEFEIPWEQFNLEMVITKWDH